MKIDIYNKKLLIFKVLIILLVALYLFTLGMFFTGCAVSPNKGEYPECYYYRVCTDSKGAVNCGKEYDSCMKVLRHERCKTECRNPDSVYKDFNDCWKTLD